MSEYLKYFCHQLNFDYPEIIVTEAYYYINHYGGDSQQIFDGYKAETLFNEKKYMIKSKESGEDAEYKLCKEIIDKEDMIVRTLMLISNDQKSKLLPLFNLLNK